MSRHTDNIRQRFKGDPARAAEALEEERLGCLLCSNSRADANNAYCLAAKVNGQPVSRIRFPFSGPGCPEFKRRAGW